MDDPASRPETTPAPSEPAGPSPWWAPLRDHPVLALVMVACTVGGAAAGVTLLAEDWTLARRLAAGAVGGAGCGLIVITTRMVGMG